MSIGGTHAVLSARVVPVRDDSEELSAPTVAALHDDVIQPIITRHGGELAGTAGNSLIAEFPDGAAAVGTALDLQQQAGSDVSFSIGIDAPEEPGRIDLAVRLEELAGEGEVYVTAPVHDAAEDVTFQEIGSHPVLGSESVEVYRLGTNGGTRRRRGVTAAAGVSLASLGLARLTGRRPAEAAETAAEAEGVACEFCDVLHIEVPASTDAVVTALPDDDAEPEFTIVGGDDEQRELAAYARDRFEEYGLGLPDVVINFHSLEDKEEKCGGHVAVARHGEDEASIDMCGTTASTLMHELTHVWAKEGLSEDIRTEFLDMRGLEHWAGGADVRWHMRGSEHAANVIAWGLQQDDPVRPSGTLPNDDDSLAAAFRLLTGGQEPVSLREALASGAEQLYAEPPAVADEDEPEEIVVAMAEDDVLDDGWDEPLELPEQPSFDEDDELPSEDADEDLPPELAFE